MSTAPAVVADRVALAAAPTAPTGRVATSTARRPSVRARLIPAIGEGWAAGRSAVTDADMTQVHDTQPGNPSRTKGATGPGPKGSGMWIRHTWLAVVSIEQMFYPDRSDGRTDATSGAVRRAALPLELLVPRRCVRCGPAGGAGGRARPDRPRGDGPSRPVRCRPLRGRGRGGRDPAGDRRRGRAHRSGGPRSGWVRRAGPASSSAGRESARDAGRVGPGRERRGGRRGPTGPSPA